MGKYYKTEDICEIIDNKLERIEKEIMSDSSLNGDRLLQEVADYRLLKANLYSFVNDLRDEDDKYEAEMAAWKAKREAENGTDT